MSDVIADQVRGFLAENFILGADQRIGDDDSLLELRIVDSTGFLELVAFIESRYSIKVEDAEMVPENLETISSIREFVLRKQAAHK